MKLHHITPQMEIAATALNKRALGRIDMQYGPDGPWPLPYHNTAHTIDVLNAHKVIGTMAVRNGNISPRQNILGQIAAGHHDIVHGLGRGISEASSARIAVDQMMDFDCFTRADRNEVARLIEATVCTVTPEGLVQDVDPDNYGTLLLADEDLCNLGMPFEQFRPRAFAMAQEQAGKRPGPNGQFMKFLFMEPSLLRNHRYHTEEARAVFTHALENADLIERQQEMYAVQ
jgi:predicted metal-dependent HD superfamily phosphohydrolase